MKARAWCLLLLFLGVGCEARETKVLLRAGARVRGSLASATSRFQAEDQPLFLTVTATGADPSLSINGRRLDLVAGPLPERIAVPAGAALELRGAFSSTGGFELHAESLANAAPLLELSERVLTAAGLGRHHLAADTLSAAETLAKAADDAERLGQAAWGSELTLAAADLYAKLGDATAETLYQRGLRAAEPPARVMLELGLATWVIDKGEMERAAEAMREARAAAGNEPYLLARVEMSEGNAARDRGDNAQGLAALERALALSRSLGDPDLTADVEAGLGWCHKELGERDVTLAHFQAEYRAAQETDDGRALGIALHNLGIIPSDFDNDMRAALPWFEKAIDAQRRAGYPGLAYSLDAAGEMESTLGLEKAMERHQEALIMRRKLHSVRGEAQTLISLGNAATRLGRPNEAIEPLVQSAKLLASVGDRTWEAYAIYRLGAAEEARGNAAEAYQQAMRALQISESLRERIASEDRRAYYTAEVRMYYDLAVAAAVRMAQKTGEKRWFERAFAASEQSKARSLVDMLMLIEPEDPDQALRQEIRSLEQTKRRLMAQGAGDEALAANEALLLPKLAEFERRQDGRTKADPLLGTALATLEETQAMLDKDTLLVELHLGRHGAFAIAVGTSTLAAYALGDAKVLDASARAVHRLNTARNQEVSGENAETRAQRVEAADASATAMSGELGQRLIDPWRAALEKKTRLVLVPDGALQYVPFAALFPGLALSTLPSVTVQKAQRRVPQVPPTSTLLVVGDPVFEPEDPRAVEDAQRAALRAGGGSSFHRLPYTRRESEAVAALVPAATRKLWLDFDATKDKLGPSAGRPRYVHLATHGVLDAARPERSGLVFSGASAGGAPLEGFLSLAEIYELHINADLVTLSACETALGAEVRGEGLIGLTRGFFHAGARAVLASLWKVNDRATERLMVSFYRNLLEERLPPPVALLRAQQDLAKDEHYRAPYYWAGFVLQGEFARGGRGAQH